MDLKEIGCEGIYVAEGGDRCQDHAAAQTWGSELLSSRVTVERFVRAVLYEITYSGVLYLSVWI